ncbi:hypothetical protein BC828DRAFT_377944 [Blastocladiella britannica]|nr:hypothetical protein BC828DRAFT_377944 [Blastocladiella britannica]
MLRAIVTRSPATAARRALVLRGADHGHHHGPTPVNPADYTSADFSTPLYAKLFLGALTAFGLFQANEYYVARKASDEVHPITAYISYHMTDEKVWKERNYAAIRDAERDAAVTLLMQEMSSSAKTFRPVAPELLERGCPHGISAGTQADLSDLQLKR